MEFWGVEVKSGQPLEVSLAEGKVLHLSQACLGEIKNPKASDSVCLHINIEGKKLVLGTLNSERLPQQLFDLVFDKDFQLSHNWKSGSVFFYGYKADQPTDDYSDDENVDSDEEKEALELPIPNGGKQGAKKEENPVVANKKDTKQKVKIVEPEKNDSDSDEDDSMSEDSDEVLSFGSISGKVKMVQTRSEGSSVLPDQINTQLAAIMAKLESVESLKEDVAQLKSQTRNKGKSSGGNGRFEDIESSWNQNRYRPYNKIDFPTFSEGDPRGWILKAEKYFRYYNIPEEEKVDVASLHLEGDALDFYSWLSADRVIEFWEELVQAIQKNFGPAEFQNPDEHLCSIQQTGTVQEYRQEFAKRSYRVTNWPEHCLLGVFLNGLKEDLKADVRIQKPRTVYKAMSIAFEFESKVNHMKSRKISTSSISTEPSPAAPKALVPASAVQRPTENRFSDAEKQGRYLRGECFRCGDKYGLGHRCKTGSFKFLEAGEEGENAAVQEQVCTDELATISLHALLGQSSLTTMKLYGILGKKEVLILIDSGSTHNFISDQLVSNLTLQTQSTVSFGVQIGTGDILRCGQVCKNLPLQISDLSISQDFYLFALGGADVVLGIQWLETLNTVQANWKEMFLKFTIDGKEYKLQGLPLDHSQSATHRYMSTAPIMTHTSGPGAPFSVTRLEGKSVLQAGCIVTSPETSGLGQTQIAAAGPGQT